MNDQSGGDLVQIVIWSLLLIIVTSFYIGAGVFSSRSPRLRNWPQHRYLLFITGVLSAGAAIFGPLAELAHMDFRYHMISHLLLGMLAPLLLVLAAPVTLILRTVPPAKARQLTSLLRSRYVSFISHPLTASLLNIGGLWILYTTGLYPLMHESLWLRILVHVHVFFAGYLFTLAMIYIEPVAHRYGYLYRTIVFVFALAAHGILSKYLYASPPEGVTKTKAETGSMIMYYGGDIIDAIIIFILCLHWYKSASPRKISAAGT
ncbi:cytochrome c oxidase assembly protein [Salimicrobium album]|uniref:Membrane protein n=1 Tax=Salimicrobium album TaxID=50717 RepID=A0A1H3BNZ3_9BACI|nr:cytochrome c oxidase assembly protein [Salimicrobium album]SDX43084.1 putative membrane protein [Salimicrobium album]